MNHIIIAHEVADYYIICSIEARTGLDRGTFHLWAGGPGDDEVQLWGHQLSPEDARHIAGRVRHMVPTEDSPFDG